MSLDETDSKRLAHEGLEGMPDTVSVDSVPAALLNTLRLVTHGSSLSQFHPCDL